jgi:hypothetical protein
MDLFWLDWSEPVAIWWGFLLAVSTLNIALLSWLHARYRRRPPYRLAGAFAIEPLLLLATVYVLGCAFRSILPRADVQRICLFDTWLSSILVGRSVATVAELCFIAQWALVLRELGAIANSDTAKNISKTIVPLIAVAECCSWYAVISTNFLGNVLENSLWTATFLLIAIALIRLLPRFGGLVQFAIATAIAGIACYVVFMCAVDVPMYFSRWQAELTDGRVFLGAVSGLRDVASRWIVTGDFAQWRDEIPWMSFYFSTAVWASLALGGFGLVKHLVPGYRLRPRPAKPHPKTVAVSVSSFR